MKKNGIRCVGCGALIMGEFCHNCGEKVTERSDYSILTFLRESFEVFTSLDNRVFRTLKILMLKPGFLTEEYFRGNRKRYLKPIQLFLVINIGFFILTNFIGNMNPFDMGLNNLLENKNVFFSGRATQMVLTEIQNEGTDWLTYTGIFDQKISTISKTLIIVYIPILAILLNLFFWRQKRFYAEHLVCSCHLFSAMIVLIMAFFSIFYAASEILDNRDLLSEQFAMPPMILALAIFLILTLKRYYKQNWAWTGAKATLTVAGLVPALILYRSILFLVVFYTI